MKTQKWIKGSFLPASDCISTGMYEAIPVLEESYTLSEVYEETCRRAGIEIGYTNFNDHSHLFEKCEDGNESAIAVVDRADEIRDSEYVEVELEVCPVPTGYIPVKVNVWIKR